MIILQDENGKKLITACVLTAGIIVLGLYVPYLNILALIAASFFVFSMCLEDVVCYMSFMVSFFPIFKLTLGGFGLYNILLAVAILKLLMISSGKAVGRFIPSFVLISIYILLTGMNNDIKGSITCICYLLFAGLISAKSKMQLDFKRLTTSAVLGVIVTSILSLLSDYIPRLATIISQARIKLGQGEYYYRFSGIEANPNYYTMIITVCIAALIVLMMQRRMKIIDYFYLGVLCIFGLMSVSNSFLVSLIVIFAMLVLCKDNEGKRNIGGLVLIGIVVGFVFLFLTDDTLATLGFRIESIKTSTSLVDTTTGRSNMWIAYLQNWTSSLTSFLFGSGVGAKNLPIGASHNYYLDVIYYLGLVGGVVYLVCLNRIFNPKYLLVRRPKLYQYIPLFAFLIRAFARNLFMSEQLVFMLLICFAAIYSGNTAQENLEYKEYC